MLGLQTKVLMSSDNTESTQQDETSQLTVKLHTCSLMCIL